MFPFNKKQFGVFMKKIENSTASTSMASFEQPSKPSSSSPILDFVSENVSKLGHILFNPLTVAKYRALSKNYTVTALALHLLEEGIRIYPQKEGGFYKQGETAEEIGQFFKPKFGHLGPKEWDVLRNNYDLHNPQAILQLLNQVYKHTSDSNLLQIRSAQVLAKKLIPWCSDQITPGFEMEFPYVDELGKTSLVTYMLDEKIDLWHGIPAFGFVDIEGVAPPLLVFRSTNNRIGDEDGPASLIANFHPRGPAWKLYRNSKDRVDAWLKDNTKDGENKARIFGYSQGGTLASYFLTHHSEWVSQKPNEPSYILDAPGVFPELAEKWKSLSEQPNVEYYVHRGDLFPKIGSEMIGRAFEITNPEKISGYDSHTVLNLLAPKWTIREIDTEKEKKSNVRQIFSALHRNVGYAVYSLMKDTLLPMIRNI